MSNRMYLFPNNELKVKHFFFFFFGQEYNIGDIITSYCITLGGICIQVVCPTVGIAKFDHFVKLMTDRSLHGKSIFPYL